MTVEKAQANVVKCAKNLGHLSVNRQRNKDPKCGII